METKKRQRVARKAATPGAKAKQRYIALLAYDVPVYGTIEFTAQNDAMAARRARRILNQWDTLTSGVCFEIEHDGADTHRIVHVKNANTKEAVAEDICLGAPCPKVLIHVRGGVATYSVADGRVEVALVDEDNINAGDPPVELEDSWRPLTEGRFLDERSKYVRFVKR